MFKIAKNNRLTPHGAEGGYRKFYQEFTVGVVDAHRGLEHPTRMTPASLAGYNWRNQNPQWKFDADGLVAMNSAAAEAWRGQQ